MRLVRVGLVEDGTLLDQKRAVETALSQVKRESARDPALLNEVSRIRLQTLEAEFLQQWGKPIEAANVLKPLWDELKPKLDVWHKTHRLYRPIKKEAESDANAIQRPLPKRDRRLLRQQIWALLHYVFYHHYRVVGDHAEALRYFLLLEEVTRAELAPLYAAKGKNEKEQGTKSGAPHLEPLPFGTLAICHYFIGLCHRVQRQFFFAEHHFNEAQKAIFGRCQRELSRRDITTADREYELAYKDVFSARALSATGWVALHQGSLSRAEHCLRVAQTHLLNTCQESLKHFIAALLLIVCRRKTPYNDPIYMKSLHDLSRQYDSYRNSDDTTMQRRCASELMRGYLDLVEFHNVDEQGRKRYLEQAKLWLDRLDRDSDKKNEIRFHLHEARFWIVSGDFTQADHALAKSRRLSAAQKIPQRAQSILVAVYWLRQGDLSNARKTLEEVLSELVAVAGDHGAAGNRRFDPVLEAECYLLLAATNVAKGDLLSARHFLGEWDILARFVESEYLTALARQIRSQLTNLAPFELAVNFDIYEGDTNIISKTILARLQEFEKWLLITITSRSSNIGDEELGEIHGTSRFTVKRRLKYFGIKWKGN